MPKRKSYDIGGGDGKDTKEKNGDMDSLTPANFIEMRPTDKVELKRSVTLINGVAIIVGSIIGSGIFINPTPVYMYAQSSYLAIAVWAMCGVFSLIGAICFAELGTCVVKSGGDFIYIYEAFGPLPGFLTLWVTIVVIRPCTAAVVALTFANYALKPFFPECDAPGFTAELLAACCLLLLTAINCISVRVTMKIQDLFTAGKLIALSVIIIMGAVRLVWGLSSEEGPKLDSNAFTTPFDLKGGSFNIAALSLSFYNGLFAYAGWNYLNMVTQELQDPYKNLPRAIWIGLPTVTIIYVLANCAYFIVLRPDEILSSPAVAVEFGKHTFGSFQWLIPIFVALSTFGGVNGTLFTSARLFFAGADEGQLPQIFACIHTKNLTPVPALLLQCLISVVYLTTGSIYALITYVSFVLWVSTGFAVGALLRLRVTKPDIPRPIRVHPILPITYIICSILLVVCSIYEDYVSTGIGTLITLTGVPAYYLFGRPSKTTPSDYVRNATVYLQKLMNVIPQEKSEALL